MDNTEHTSLMALLSNLVLFIQVLTSNENKKRTTRTSNIGIPEALLSQFGNILVEKSNISEPGSKNITQLFFMEESKSIVMEYVSSVLKEAMERERNNPTLIIEALIEYFLNKLSDKQKQQAEAEILSEESEKFYGILLIDIFKINQTIAMAKSHRKFIRKSYERFSQFFPHVTDRQITEHDLSKFDFVELIGYTAR